MSFENCAICKLLVSHQKCNAHFNALINAVLDYLGFLRHSCQILRKMEKKYNDGITPSM